MTAPLAPAPPAPAPTAASPAATDAPDGRERFASALDDAVAGEQGGPRGQERATEADGAPVEPAPEAPAGEQSVTEQPTAGQPVVSPAGAPPALWALLTGIGPGAPATVTPQVPPAVALTGDPALAVGTTAPVAAPAAGSLAPAAVDILPPGAPGTTGTVGAGPTSFGAVLPAGTTSPAALVAAAPPAADPLPGFTVLVAGPEPPAAPAADDALAAAVPADVPAAAPTAAEGAGTDTGSAPGQDTASPAPAPAAASSSAAVATTVATTSPAATAEPAAPATPAQPVSGQVAQQVAVLRSAPDGTHAITVVLTPETLGPVEVQVTLSQGSVELALRSATEAGRAALLDALPDLRRDLQSAGLTCGSATVDRDSDSSWTSAQQQTGGNPSGHDRGDTRPRSWLRTPDADPARPAHAAITPASGLDVRV